MSRSHQPGLDDEVEDEFFDEMPTAGEGSKRAKRLALALLGRWYWMALGLILGLLGSYYYLTKAPLVYTSVCSLLMKTQTDSLMSRDQVEEVSLGSSAAMNTAVVNIQRFELLERVASREDVRDLSGLIPPPVDWRPEWLVERLDGDQTQAASKNPPVPPPSQLAGYLSGWVSASVIEETRLLQVRVNHRVPEVAKALADAVAREFVAEIRDDVTQGRRTDIEVLRDESETARQKLQTATTARAVYARALLANEALDAQEVVVARLDRRYLPAHPKMQEANAEFERQKQRFIEEFELARRSPNDSTYWQGVSRQLPDPEVDRDDYLRIARQLLMARINVLDSEISSQTKVFNGMLTRIQEIGVNQGSEEDTSTRINSLARVPGSPSAPKASSIYTSGIGAGLAGGLVVAFLLTRLDNKFETVAQVESETGMPVLSAISDIPPNHLDQAARRYFKTHPEEESEAFDEWDPLLVFRPGTLHTSYAEMYRNLRASVTLLGNENERKVTLFTSALPGEGKTATSANFALASASQKRRTLLIDCDFRKPAVHRVLGLDRSTEKGGISDVLAGQVSIADTVHSGFPAPYLHVITSGTRVPNPGELLDTGRLKAVLELAARHYDVIVLDTAPLLAVPDTRVIASLADNICLVIRGDYTPRGAVHRALSVLREDGTNVSGSVFNGFKERRRLIGQNYSYGYYQRGRYGYRYGYGTYGTYGTYGSYGADEEDDSSPKKGRRVGNRKRRRRKVAS